MLIFHNLLLQFLNPLNSQFHHNLLCGNFNLSSVSTLSPGKQAIGNKKKILKLLHWFRLQGQYFKTASKTHLFKSCLCSLSLHSLRLFLWFVSVDLLWCVHACVCVCVYVFVCVRVCVYVCVCDVGCVCWAHSPWTSLWLSFLVVVVFFTCIVLI